MHLLTVFLLELNHHFCFESWKSMCFVTKRMYPVSAIKDSHAGRNSRAKFSNPNLIHCCYSSFPSSGGITRFVIGNFLQIHCSCTVLFHRLCLASLYRHLTMVAVAAAVVSAGVVVALLFLLIKFAMAVRDFHHVSYLLKQFPHNKGHFIWGNLFEVGSA